jgi:hypothetical protein
VGLGDLSVIELVPDHDGEVRRVRDLLCVVDLGGGTTGVDELRFCRRSG